jgi:two-component system phosphate regulon response regulator PhoB
MITIARAAARDADSRSLLIHGDLRVDLEAFRVTYLGHQVHVGPIPYRLLIFMLGSPGIVHAREEMISAVWPSGTRIRAATVNMHVLRLRAALAAYGGAGLIMGIRGIGYGLRALPKEAGRSHGDRAPLSLSERRDH